MSATDTGPGYPPGSLRFSRPEGCGELLHAVVRLEGQADNWGRLVRKVLYLHASRPRRRRGWLNGPASVATSLEGEGPRVHQDMYPKVEELPSCTSVPC